MRYYSGNACIHVTDLEFDAQTLVHCLTSFLIRKASTYPLLEPNTYHKAVKDVVIWFKHSDSFNVSVNRSITVTGIIPPVRGNLVEYHWMLLA
jgi:hypothetical protein